jgi:hypothetical protein
VWSSGFETDSDSSGFESIAEVLHGGSAQAVLDASKELVLLAPDVGPQEGSKGLEALDGGLGAEVGDLPFHGAVFSNEGFNLGIRAEFGEDGGKEPLFLEFEVVDEFEVEAVGAFGGEALNCGGGGIPGQAAFNEDAESESVVVLMGQRVEALVTAHRWIAAGSELLLVPSFAAGRKAAD